MPHVRGQRCSTCADARWRASAFAALLLLARAAAEVVEAAEGNAANASTSASPSPAHASVVSKAVEEDAANVSTNAPPSPARASVVNKAYAKEGEEHMAGEEDRACAVMLLGSIGFMMSIFYLTNHRDKHFRMYAWKVVSSTISIFSAVLLFQAINGLVEQIAVQRKHYSKVFVAFIHSFAWFFILQATLAILTGAVDICWLRHYSRRPEKRRKGNLKDRGTSQPLLGASNAHNHGDELEEEADTAKEEVLNLNVESNVKSTAVLLGHITGFSSIHAWSTAQQFFQGSILRSFGFVPLSYMALRIINCFTNAARDYVSKEDDGVVDKMEELWDEEAEETEDDVIGLTVSFLIAQIFRMGVTGKMPNEEGEEKPLVMHSNKQGLELFSLGMIMLGIELVRTVILPPFGRVTHHVQNIAAMTFSWCVYFCLDWFLYSHLKNATDMLYAVYLAVILTVISFSCIWLIEWFAELDCTGSKTDKSLGNVIFALATSIGFSWEKCFDIAVTSIAKSTKDPAVCKVVLAIILAALVVPAWRWFIYPHVLEMSNVLREEASPIKHRESLEGLTEDRMEKYKADKLKMEEELASTRREYEKHRKRADVNEAHVKDLQKMHDEFAEEAKHFRELADRLQLPPGP